MTELYLKKQDGDWQRAYFTTSGSGFKLVRENPYFTQSEAYTLDVTLPMDIAQNRMLLGSLHRMDCSKQPPVYKCRLIVNNALMLDGSAKVTQVTEKEVKVQLVGGRSEVNFLSDNNNDYIDQLPLGTRRRIESTLAFYSDISSGLRYSNSYLYNETAETFVDPLCACHPQLVGVMRLLLSHYGFDMQQGFLDQEPWNRIFIASALHTLDIAHKLPHWPVRDFIQEFCNFFNVTPVIDQFGKTVQFVSNMDYYAQESIIQTLQPIDEYSAELTDDDSHSSIASSTVAFDLSGSAAHDYDCLSEGMRTALPRLHYATRTELENAFKAMDAGKRRKYIFCSPNEERASWLLTDRNGENDFENLVYVDLMKPLDRGTDKAVTLKIVPVAIGHEAVALKNANDGTHRNFHGIPTMESPTKDEEPYPWFGEDGTLQLPDVQDVISGEESIDTAEKEDRMQVMFDDGRTFAFAATPNQLYPLAFTDWKYKPDSEVNHRHWSLALNTNYADAYLGQLHQNAFSFNVHSKLVFRFIADVMPDPTRVYIIRGKRYGCEKFEASVTPEGFDRLMTGYFYEMLSHRT